MKIETDIILKWFRLNRRDLPWRKERTGYRVWVSEVMLQQTQVDTVIPYFLRFMERFPTPLLLAKASLEEVYALWEGLGYYRRARFLWQGAKELVALGGKLPESKEELLAFSGIGDYTAGAIASFAFGKRAVAIDGNIERLLSRLFALDDKKRLVEFFQKLIPEDVHAEGLEALIEFGALVCRKRPSCFSCPLNKSCKAFEMGDPLAFPKKKARPKTTLVFHRVFLQTDGSKVLIERYPEGGLFSGLFGFPKKEITADEKEFAPTKNGLALPTLSHSFTRYKATLFPWRFESADLPFESDHLLWVEKKDLGALPFIAGHRQLKLHLL